MSPLESIGALRLPTEAGSVGGVGGTSVPTPIGAGTETGGTSGVSFGGVLAKMVDDASALDRTAAQKIDALASGASDDLHGTMIAAKEAEISVKLVSSVRNKLLDAFHEIWRTSV
jgi:flagellar hook-basal body complex protein FliE